MIDVYLEEIKIDDGSIEMSTVIHIVGTDLYLTCINLGDFDNPTNVGFTKNTDWSNMTYLGEL